MGLHIQVQSGHYTVARYSPDVEIPPQLFRASFYCIARTADETSVVFRDEDFRPENAQKIQGQWRMFKLIGPFDFSLTGVLASILKPLAQAEIGIFAFSTFDTDYVLVQDDHFIKAFKALESAGHTMVS